MPPKPAQARIAAILSIIIRINNFPKNKLNINSNLTQTISAYFYVTTPKFYVCKAFVFKLAGRKTGCPAYNGIRLSNFMI